MNTKQETPAQTPVKVSRGKKSFDKRFRPYVSEKGTQPINDVYDGDKVFEGLTDDEKVAEGILPPLAWQAPKDSDGNSVGRFQKTTKEREELKRVHSGKKGPSGGGRKSVGKGEPTETLIIYRANVYKRKDFKTTISLLAKKSEIPFLVGQFHDPEKRKMVIKYHFMGKTYTID